MIDVVNLILDDIVRRVMPEFWPWRESSDPDILFLIESGGPSDDDIGFERSNRLDSSERGVVVENSDVETASNKTSRSPFDICVFAKPLIAYNVDKAMRSRSKP